jgi:hypothetical protein
MIELKSGAAEQTGYVDLFSIDDVTYQMPTKVKTNVALKYLRMVRTHGQEAAMGWVMEQVLGEDAYAALMDFDDLTEADLESVMEAVRANVMGAVEAPKGRRKSA